MIEILNRWNMVVIRSIEADNLVGADLRDASLRDASLRDADLRGADLRDADLRDANLRYADLRDANLRYADLSGADLSGANLRGADLSGANCLHAVGDFLRVAGTRHTIIAVDEEHIAIGCTCRTLAWWHENYEATGRNAHYTAAQIEEYRLHIEYVAKWLAAMRQAKKAAA